MVKLLVVRHKFCLFCVEYKDQLSLLHTLVKQEAPGRTLSAQLQVQDCQQGLSLVDVCSSVDQSDGLYEDRSG